MTPLPRSPAPPLVACVLATLLVAGCGMFAGSSGSEGFGAPIGPSVAALGLRDRCVETDMTCQRQAARILVQMAESLGNRYDGPGATDTSGRVIEGTLLIVYQRDPAIPWQAGTQDGPVASGTTGRIVVDLAPVLSGGVAYAVVDSPAGPQRFAVPLGQSGQLLDALYAPLGP